MRRSSIFIVLLLLLAFSSPARSLKIEITNPTLRPVRLFLAGGGDAAAALRDRIVADLKIVPNIEFVAVRENADHEISFTVAGSTFEATLTQVKSGEYVAFKVTPWSSDAAGNAHLLADRLYEKMTDTLGLFSTRIAFSMNWNGVRQIFVTDIAGTRIQKITANKADSIAPKMSPDRRYIIYTNYGRSSGTSIRLIDLDTLEDRLVVASPDMNITGAFSEDSRSFFYVTYDGKISKIFEYSMAAGTRQLIHSSRARLVSPVVTYMPGRIAFVSDELGSPQVFTLSLKDKAVKRVTYNHGYASSPSFTRHGTHYAYLGQNGGKNRIYITSLDGADFVALTHGDKNHEDPVWFANERFVLCHAAEGKNAAVYLIDIPTQKQIKLFTLPAAVSYLTAG